MLYLALWEEPEAVKQANGLVHCCHPVGLCPLCGAWEVNWHPKQDDAGVLNEWKHRDQSAGMIKWESDWVAWEWITGGLNAGAPQAAFPKI
jgi:hypothetical protein